MIYVMAALNYGVRTGDVGTARNYVLFDWPLVYAIGMICDLCTSLHHLPTIRTTLLIRIHASQRHGMIAWAIAMLQPLGLVEREFRTEKLVNAHSIAIKKSHRHATYPTTFQPYDGRANRTRAHVASYSNTA